MVRVVHHVFAEMDAGGHSLSRPRETSSGAEKLQGIQRRVELPRRIEYEPSEKVSPMVVIFSAEEIQLGASLVLYRRSVKRVYHSTRLISTINVKICSNIIQLSLRRRIYISRRDRLTCETFCTDVSDLYEGSKSFNDICNKRELYLCKRNRIYTTFLSDVNILLIVEHSYKASFELCWKISLYRT